MQTGYPGTACRAFHILAPVTVVGRSSWPRSARRGLKPACAVAGDFAPLARLEWQRPKAGACFPRDRENGDTRYRGNIRAHPALRSKYRPRRMVGTHLPRCLQRGAFHAARSCGEGAGVSFYVPCRCGAMGLGGCILGSALLKLAPMALPQPSDEPERIARFEPSTDRQAMIRRVELNSGAKDIDVENREARDPLHRNRAV